MSSAEVVVSVEFQWQGLGAMKRDERGFLAFPPTPCRPGLYRFRLCGNGAARHYVGETEDLRRRFQHFRTPGRTQQTNIRLNSQCQEHMAGGGEIEVDIVVDKVEVTTAGTALDVGLADETMRRLLERAAMIRDAAAGIELLNRCLPRDGRGPPVRRHRS